MARLPAFFNQQSPLEHDVLAYPEGALLEHRPDPVREPVVQLGPARRIDDLLDAEANFGNVTMLTNSRSSGWEAMKRTTLVLGLGRRNSDRMFVSSSQPVTDLHRARAAFGGAVRCLWRDAVMPAVRRSEPLRSARPSAGEIFRGENYDLV